MTSAQITAINADVSVTYSKKCHKGSFDVIFTNQVIVDSSNFSDSGDSGSLIVTDDACHNPVALLTAGNKESTSGNPIREVMNALNVRVVGSNVDCAGVALKPGPETSDQSLKTLLARLLNLTCFHFRMWLTAPEAICTVATLACSPLPDRKLQCRDSSAKNFFRISFVR